jgi:transcriptional regulator with XRE-family HTH domain
MVVNSKAVGVRIRKKRVELGVNQKELAERVQISPSAINQYEKGEKLPSTETLVKLAHELKTTTDYLIGASVEEDFVIGASVVDAFNAFKELSPQDQQNIISNIHFLKERSSSKE